MPAVSKQVKAKLFELGLLLVGVYAWLTTVLPTLVQSAPLPWWGMLAGWICLLSIPGTVILREKRWQTPVGVDLCLGSALLCWLSGSRSDAGLPILFGAIAWFLFTLCWGLADAPLQSTNARGGHWSPRRKMRPLSIVIQSVTTLLCLWLFSLPRQVDRPAVQVLTVLVVLFVSIVLQVASARLGSQIQHPDKGAQKTALAPYLVHGSILAAVICFIYLQS